MNRVRDTYLLTPDQQWLDHMNAKRRAEQLDVISYEAFEIILDRLKRSGLHLSSGFLLAFLLVQLPTKTNTRRTRIAPFVTMVRVRT